MASYLAYKMFTGASTFGWVESFFRTVQEDPPDDIEGRLLDLTDEKRFLEAQSEDGTWRLTSKGVNYVKNRLLGGTA